MHLDPKQTRAFLSVLETGSFEQAGIRLHVTASAISQRVRALETAFGGPLIIRTRPCRATSSGKRLLQYLRRASQLEHDLVADMNGQPDASWPIVLAVNADTLATWFFPSLCKVLSAERVLLDLTVDDQDHTYQSLEAGRVIGCISTQAKAMRGCNADLLGIMRYRLVATKHFKELWFPKGLTREAARLAPVIAHTRKDELQSRFLKKKFGLLADSIPHHYVPAPEPRLAAIEGGLGYGMVPDLQLREALKRGRLIDLATDSPTDVALYWHSWKVKSPRMEHLSEKILKAGRASLRLR